ncbi:MAG: hypothetical protein FWD35_02775, partial [Oscillospiraceae bacterium]|nr:hypothetical protein [Oscillospiraceae bacterium]
KRQHRWLRGDLQNAAYMFDSRFSPLTRFKLFDNVRRAITPLLILLCFFTLALPAGIVALAAIVLPFLTGFLPGVIRGRRFSAYRRFYSPVLTQTKQLVRQCIMEVMLLPKHALVSLDALWRVFWRLNFSRKRLLDWTTASAFDGKSGGITHMLGAVVVAALLFGLSLVTLNPFPAGMAVLFLAALPVVAYCDKSRGETKTKIPDTVRRDLSVSAKQIWQFYEDFVTSEHSFLPPDNVQYSPIERVAARTSPTNIGMYLLSCVSAYVFGFIDRAGLEKRVERTLATVEKLPKWNGNLYNWYDTRSLELLDGFVSSVDSGNYVCCLVALGEALKHEDCNPELITRLSRQIDDTDLKPFYNKTRNLFSIGYDASTDTLSHHHYDLLMSEARMLSYYAIASGQANKRHWRSLGRVMGKKGKYAAPVAWTGTMFEYFMPELLLNSKEGSMQYEALRFCLHCQQSKTRAAGAALPTRSLTGNSFSGSRPYGISESGYYAFDRNMNYQYKAHGVQDIGLKSGLDREYVVSPYSTFLALSYDPIGCYNNLAKMERLGLCHERYGFYEAADFTPHRVGTGYAVVKSHMAHHMGMSICAITNTLYGGIMQKLFMGNEKMKRAGELMEEKIIAGEPVLGPPERKEEKELRMNADIFTGASGFSLENPRLNLLSNGQISVITSDIGVSQTLFSEGRGALFPTVDLYRPRGAIYAVIDGKNEYVFGNHPKIKATADNCVVFTQNTTEYLAYTRNFKTRMDVFLDEANPVEFRTIMTINKEQSAKKLVFAAYLEPALGRECDILAHPAFMDLFVKAAYDSENKLITASRKERDGDGQWHMAVGFCEDVELSYSFNREEVITRGEGVFSALKKSLTQNDNTDVPAPCMFIRAEFALKAGEKKSMTMFTCYGNSLAEVVALAREVRAKFAQSGKVEPSEEIISPLVSDTIYGRLTRRHLGKLLYAAQTSRIRTRATVPDLWKHGISGDNPIAVYNPGKKADRAVTGIDAVIEMKKALSLCQIEYDLVLLYDTAKQRELYSQLCGEIGTQAFILDKTKLEAQDLALLFASASLLMNADELLRGNYAPPLNQSIATLHKAARLEPAVKPKSGEFAVPSHISNADYGQPPWCNVLANSRFGTLVSDRSLGFTWALNSRENKLTPWVNDLRADNRGEMLILKSQSGLLYDLIDGSAAAFAPSFADYAGVAAGCIEARTQVRVYSRGMGKSVSLELTNTSDTARRVQIAYYCEPVLGVNKHDLSNKLLSAAVVENSLVISSSGNQGGYFSGAMILSANKKSTFMSDKSAFWSGDWPASAVDNGQLSAVDNGQLSAVDSWFNCEIGAVIIKIDLPPRRTEKIKFVLSFTRNTGDPLSMEKALKKTRSFVALPKELKHGEINSGNAALDELYKHWLPWQVIGGRIWARTGFYQNSGAFGFRDQLQDCLAAVCVLPQVAKTQILRCCTAQFPEGDVLHWWHEFPTTTGIKKKGVRTRYSDDLLWLPYVLADYVEQTGDTSILDLQTRYCCGDTLAQGEHERYSEAGESELVESVYNHAKRALQKGYNTSDRGLLLIGGGDWCDGYNKVGVGGKGESVWLCMFYAMTAKKFAKIAKTAGDIGFAVELEGQGAELLKKVDELCWNSDSNDCYHRAFYDDGTPMAVIDLLPQAFAVLAEMPDDGRVSAALGTALRELYDRDNRIVKLFTPPFNRDSADKTTGNAHNAGYVESYPPGVRENGGQYTHSAIWLALACHRAGLTEQAKELLEAISPLGRAAEYKCEPYYLAADVYSNPKAYGRGGWSIYTGSASWYYRVLREVWGK